MIALESQQRPNKACEKGENMFRVRYLFMIVSLFYSFTNAKNAIVIGASSGMGRQVAKLLAKEGYIVGLVARRMELLTSLAQEIKTKTYTKCIDVAQHGQAIEDLNEFIKEMSGLDLIVISISASNDNINTTNSLENYKRTLNVDLLGFWYMANTALEYFYKQGHGHLVGISSTSGLIGQGENPVYSGAKAFIQRYLEGVRNKLIQSKINTIFITDIIPGWVEVEAEDVHKIPGAYWVATTQEAAKQIVNAIKKKKKKAYITARWEIIALLYKICPDWLYNKIGGF